MPESLIVFDMDGVLVDVTASFRVAVARTVETLGGGAVPPEAIQAVKNEGGYNNDWDLTRELLRRRGMEVERERVIEVFHSLYRGELIDRERWMLPEAEMEALGARHRLAIFTGRPRQDAEYTLRLFKCRERFASVVALEDVEKQKPSPEGLERLAREHAPLPIAAYVGDTVDDARCAAAAGVRFYPVYPAGMAKVDTPHLTWVAPDGRLESWLRSPAAEVGSARGVSKLPRTEQRAALAGAFAALGCGEPDEDVGVVARRLLAPEAG